MSPWVSNTRNRSSASYCAATESWARSQEHRTRLREAARFLTEQWQDFSIGMRIHVIDQFVSTDT
jgi:hypothetical protein